MDRVGVPLGDLDPGPSASSPTGVFWKALWGARYFRMSWSCLPSPSSPCPMHGTPTTRPTERANPPTPHPHPPRTNSTLFFSPAAHRRSVGTEIATNLRLEPPREPPDPSPARKHALIGHHRGCLSLRHTRLCGRQLAIVDCSWVLFGSIPAQSCLSSRDKYLSI